MMCFAVKSDLQLRSALREEFVNPARASGIRIMNCLGGRPRRRPSNCTSRLRNAFVHFRTTFAAKLQYEMVRGKGDMYL